jgi:23S rRNA pseudouridine2605 synthase
MPGNRSPRRPDSKTRNAGTHRSGRPGGKPEPGARPAAAKPTPAASAPEAVHGFPMRINRYLAQCGFGSRRAVEDLIRFGRVAVMGEVVTDLGHKVEVGAKVTVDGKAARPPRAHVYGVLNKPAGYLCSATDPYDRPTIYDLLRSEHSRLHYVGRLDYQSRGLLILTTDGDLTQKLLHPSHQVPRTYAVRTHMPFTEAELSRLRQGVEIGEGVVAKAVKARKTAEGAEIVIREGKNREIRRMLEVLGHKVIDLQRTRFGGLELGDLPEGDFRLLEADEVARLHGKPQPAGK